jgi:pyruvate-formate lyase-activating enzyme
MEQVSTNFDLSVLEIIKKYITPMHSAVVFLGGEPTIWGIEFIAVLKQIRNMPLSIKVFSNGLEHELILEICKLGLVDMFSIDFKCVKNVNKMLDVIMQDEEYLARVSKSISYVLKYSIGLELRTTSDDGFIINEIIDYAKAHFAGVPHIINKEYKKIKK